MALQQDYNLKGLIATNAYHKINSVTVNKEASSDVIVDVYTDSTKANQLNTVIFSFDYDVNGAEALTQAYTFLKTLPEFSGATDV